MTSRKVTGKITNVATQKKMARTPSLVDMADCEILERFWLLREHIQWLVDELREELERNRARSCPLSPETEVNVVLLLLLLLSFTCLKSACLQLHINLKFANSLPTHKVALPFPGNVPKTFVTLMTTSVDR